MKLPLLLLLVGCGSADNDLAKPRTGPPDSQLIDQIEHSLSLIPCVGGIAGWHRDYRYDPRRASVDRSLIVFSLTRGYGTTRTLSLPNDTGYIPAGRSRMTVGTFNVRTHAIRFWRCNQFGDGPIPN